MLKKIKSLDRELRFSELEKVLDSFGYKLTAPKSGSSHCTFGKNGCNPITIPRHEPIKVAYVKMVKEVVESEEKKEKEDSK